MSGCQEPAAPDCEEGYGLGPGVRVVEAWDDQDGYDRYTFDTPVVTDPHFPEFREMAEENHEEYISATGRIRVQVFNTNDDDSSVEVRVSVGSALSPQPTPIVLGDPKVGQVLTAVHGNWGPSEVALRTDWLRDGNTVVATNTTSYTVKPADVGHIIQVRVTGTLAGYVDAEQFSSELHVWTLEVHYLPDDNFVAQAYRDFLRDEPSWDEIETAESVITQRPGQDGRLLLVRQLAVSDQWLAKFITDQYETALRRAPDDQGLGWWQNVLRSGVSPVQAGASFFASDEYFNDTDYGGHGDLTTWIKALYRDLLVGHTPNQSELSFYLNWIAQMQAAGKNAVTARLAVATGFYQSPEKLGLRVKGLYNDLLHRDPEDQSAYDFWDPVVRDYGDLRLAGDLAASAEYYTKAQTLH